MDMSILDGEETGIIILINDELRIICARPIYGPMRYDPEKDSWEGMDDEEFSRAYKDSRPAWDAMTVYEAIERWKRQDAEKEAR